MSRTEFLQGAADQGAYPLMPLSLGMVGRGRDDSAFWSQARRKTSASSPLPILSSLEMSCGSEVWEGWLAGYNMKFMVV